MSNDDLTRDSIRAMRRSYGEVGLESLPADPFAAFSSWLKEAADNPVIVEANAMVLSTLGSDSNGNDAISTRTVLLKDISQGGFTFFSNYSSRKAQAIEMNSQVTLLFPWYAMERQVSISGFAEKIERSESDDYFATRPWSSQIGAWASAQSAPLATREELSNALRELRKNGPKEQQFHARRIGAVIALLRSASNFGRAVTRAYMIACAMSGLTPIPIGKYIGTTRSLAP